MPMRMNLFAERPEDSEVECYLLTDHEQDTVYAYWKVLYEKVTEESLYADYVIQNVSLSKKGRSRKFSAASAYSFGNNQEILKKSANIKKPTKSFKTMNFATTMLPSEDTKLPYTKQEEVKYPKETITLDTQVRRADKFSYDEMDLLGSSYKKTTQRARKISNTEEIVCSKKRLYAPIGICIKTINPYTTKAKDLLQSIISVLAKHEETYATAIHSIIFSYAEFCSHVLSLTQLTTPPPFTELVIPMPGTEIVYYQGLISNIPCESDISIVYLFQLLSTDYIITLWTALLLEKNIIIYTSKPNVYFYIAKALFHLIFPFDWHFLKGIIPNLELLSPPTPYCFGVLKSVFSSRCEIVKILSEDEINYIMIDIDFDREPIIDNTHDESLIYPNMHKLKNELDKCCKKFEVNTDKPLEHKLLFVEQVQNIFLNEMMQLLNGFEYALKKDRGKEVESFRELFINYKKELKSISGCVKDIKFITQITQTQAFVSLRDEAIHNKQGNYARMEAMNVQGKAPPIELSRVSLYSTPNIVLSRLFRLIELKMNREDKTLIPLRKKFDWIKEIMKMKNNTAIIEKPEEYYASLLNSLNLSNDSSTIYRDKRLVIGDIKDYSMYGSYLVPSTDSIIKNKRTTIKLGEVVEENKKGQKRVHFYGSKGILAFLDEFMRLDSDSVWKTGIIEEERNVLEYYRKHAVGNSNAVDTVPVYVEDIEDQLDLSLDAVGSMIKLKNSMTLDLSLLNDTPFLCFNNSSCLQFQLFLGIFCYKHDPMPMHAVNAFLKAFSYIEGYNTYSSYFPTKFFKLLLNKLTVEELRKLLQVPSELASIIRLAYEDRIKENITIKRKTTHDPKPAIEFLIEQNVLKRQSDKVTSVSYNKKKHEEHKGYLNDGNKASKLFDSNPNTVIVHLLSDMLTLLEINKSKEIKVFSSIVKLPLFEIIERQAGNLRVSIALKIESEFP